VLPVQRAAGILPAEPIKKNIEHRTLNIERRRHSCASTFDVRRSMFPYWTGETPVPLPRAAGILPAEPILGNIARRNGANDK